MDLTAFAERDYRGKRHPCRRKTTHAQHIMAMRRAVIACVAHLNEIRAGRREDMLKTTIDVQTRIVVALGNPATARIAQRHQRIDVCTETIADDLERNTLAGHHVNGEAINFGLAEAAP